MIRLCAGDLLEAPTAALLLTIDGSRQGMEGNIARQFEKRWRDDWQDMQHAIRYPIPLGRTVAVNWEGNCPWNWLLIASTLHHLGTLADSEKLAIVRNAFHEALGHCHRLRLKSMASTVMRGGWRLPLRASFEAMLDAWQASPARHSGLAASIFVTDDGERALLDSILSCRHRPP